MGRRVFVTAAAVLALTAGLVVTAVLAFPAGRDGRFAAGPTPVPASLESYVFTMCEPNLDRLTAELTPHAEGNQVLAISTDGSGSTLSVGVEAPGAWRVEASRAGVTVENENENGMAVGSAVAPPVSEAIAAAQELYTCLSRFRFVDVITPATSSSQLVQWYKYDAVVLWPCLAAHGVDVGDPPSRQDFADAFRAQGVDPFQELNFDPGTIPDLVAALRQCPLRPSYLH